MFRHRLLPRLAGRLLAEPALPVGRIGRVRVLVHPSGLFLALAILAGVAAPTAPALVRYVSPVARVAAAGGVTLLLFLSILVREWARAAAAEREGIASRAIVFTLFGGFARLEREPGDPGAEWRVATAGPLASVVVALLFSAATVWLAGIPEAVRLVPLAGALALVNTLLAALQSFPALPLDGGRIFRAMLWQVNGCRDRSSWLAARTSRWFALSAIGIGAVLLAGGHAGGVAVLLGGWCVGECAIDAEEEARRALSAQLEGASPRTGRLQVTNARARNVAIPGRLPSTPNAPPVHTSAAVDETSKSAASS